MVYTLGYPGIRPVYVRHTRVDTRVYTQSVCPTKNTLQRGFVHSRVYLVYSGIPGYKACLGHTRVQPECRLTFSNVGAFGSRPRQFSGLSACSQLLIADVFCFCFPGSIHGPRMGCPPPPLFSLFGFVCLVFFSCFFCAQHEGT